MSRPHEVLGVPRRASLAEIRKKFYAEAKVCHPDKIAPGESPEVAEKMKRRFLDIHEAYETLVSAAEADEPVSVPLHMPEEFGVTEQQVEEVWADRSEAEEYMLSLRSLLHRGGDWSEKEHKALRSSWAKALRAVESLVRREAEMRAFMSYSSAMLNRHRAWASSRRSQQAAASSQSVLGADALLTIVPSVQVAAAVARPDGLGQMQSGETSQAEVATFAAGLADEAATSDTSPHAELGVFSFFRAVGGAFREIAIPRGVRSAFRELADDAVEALQHVANCLPHEWTSCCGPRGARPS